MLLVLLSAVLKRILMGRFVTVHSNYKRGYQSMEDFTEWTGPTYLVDSAKA